MIQRHDHLSVSSVFCECVVYVFECTTYLLCVHVDYKQRPQPRPPVGLPDLVVSGSRQTAGADLNLTNRSNVPPLRPAGVVVGHRIYHDEGKLAC